MGVSFQADAGPSARAPGGHRRPDGDQGVTPPAGPPASPDVRLGRMGPAAVRPPGPGDKTSGWTGDPGGGRGPGQLRTGPAPETARARDRDAIVFPPRPRLAPGQAASRREPTRVRRSRPADGRPPAVSNTVSEHHWASAPGDVAG
ncbi:hypothetical protein BCD48_09110 [Pseudofrankia sp. BMG5.36]|nr:hypothetical protein BCD48_09110 [Pseudofrankia sp. BMG5.36]